MIKKAIWVYLGLYVVGGIALIASYVIKDVSAGNLDWVTYILTLLIFVPAGALALGLSGKKVPILLSLFGLLIIAVPVAGIFNFNNLDWTTIGKALLFAPMIGSLLYYVYKRLFKK